ncbi:hypothetical protein ACWCP6_14575 [Streptomyces sp. NPDC002004]
MSRPPTAAQRRIIQAADPVTGRLRGTETQLAALVRLRLAFRHPRPPHDCFLTPEGHRVRAESGTDSPSSADPAGSAPAGSPAAVEPAAGPAATAARPGVFAARTGGEPDVVDGPARVREVYAAWQGLLEMRRMTNPDGATDRPGPWERTHLVPAAALALEAAGCAPAAPGREGYRVMDTPQPEAVAVRAPGPDALRACADALDRAGWQTGAHREPRTGDRYLLASPRRA